MKWVLDQGPEQRESKMTVICLLIIIILISLIIIYYINIKLLNYGEPSQPKLETEQKKLSVVDTHQDLFEIGVKS